MGNAFADSLKQIVPSRIISPIERPLKSKGVCRTVALEDQTLQAKKGCTVVPPVINAVFKCS